MVQSVLQQYSGMRVKTQVQRDNVPKGTRGTLRVMNVGTVRCKQTYHTNCCDVPLYTVPKIYPLDEPPLIGDHEEFILARQALYVFWDDPVRVIDEIELKQGAYLPEFLTPVSDL
jgi:hypothetical protein